MKRNITTFIKFAPLSIGLLILLVGALFVPWHDTIPYLFKISPLTYCLLLLIGICYYLVRSLRYAYMLSELGLNKSLKDIVIAYFEAQPLSLLPGGEAFRTVTLKERANVPFAKSIPVVFLQSFTENIGLVALALFSALFVHRYVALVAGVLAIYGVILVLVRARRTAKHSHKWLNRIPFVSITLHKVRSFILHNRTLLSGKSFVVLILSSFISTLLAVGAVYLIALSFGVNLNFNEATLAFTLPMIIQNTTFLPGGFGANEQSSVGLLLLIGLPTASAVALTIMIRMITQILGIVIGLLFIGYGKLAHHR
jgi:uncharacterized protein (TIRG00374 family)